jgi:hypothetical protein
MKRLLLLLVPFSSQQLYAQQHPEPAASAAATASLVHITEGGELIETERTPEHSVMVVRKAPQGSVPASLFAMKGACAITRARGEVFFTSAPHPGAPGALAITFPKVAPQHQPGSNAKPVISLEQCRLLKF